MPWLTLQFRGWNADLPPDAVPADQWTLLANAVSRDGIAERYRGANQLAWTNSGGAPNAALTRPEWFAPLYSNIGNSILYAGNDIAGPRARVVQYVAGVGHGDVTPGGWAATPTTVGNKWTGGPCVNGLLLNDQTHEPVWYNAAAAPTLIGGALRFGALRGYRYQAVGITDVAAPAPQTVYWSASSAPGVAPSTWTASATNDAGDVDIPTAGQANLIDGGQLGEDFMIYASNATHVMTYLEGSTRVMDRRQVSGSTGILARNCYADLGNAHFLVTQDDIVLMTQRGVERSLLDGRLRRYIFDSLYRTGDVHIRSQVWHDTRRGRVWFAVPNNGATNYLAQAFVWEISTDTWGIVDLLNTGSEQILTGGMAATEAAQFARQQLIVADRGAGASLSQGNLYVADSTAGGLASGATTLERTDIDGGDASVVKGVRAIRVRGTSSVSNLTVKVQVGTKLTGLDQAYTWAPAVTCQLNATTDVPFTVDGRWLGVRIAGALVTDGAFRVHGVDLELVRRGQY